MVTIGKNHKDSCQSEKIREHRGMHISRVTHGVLFLYHMVFLHLATLFMLPEAGADSFRKVMGWVTAIMIFSISIEIAFFLLTYFCLT